MTDETCPIAAVKATDLTAYRALSAARWKLKDQERAALDGLRDATCQPVSRLRARATRLMGPHRIEWIDAQGYAVNHVDWTIHPNLFGKVWPHNPGPFAVWARAHIDLSITARDLKEFDAVCLAVKAAADRLAETLFLRPRAAAPTPGEEGRDG